MALPEHPNPGAGAASGVTGPPAPPRSPWPLRAVFAAYVIALAAFCFVQDKTLFAWPAGIVTGNLLASAIWAPLAVVHLDRLARRHHREHLALMHRQHRQHMAALRGGPGDGPGSAAAERLEAR
jgi:hypothetical protein